MAVYYYVLVYVLQVVGAVNVTAILLENITTSTTQDKIRRNTVQVLKLVFSLVSSSKTRVTKSKFIIKDSCTSEGKNRIKLLVLRLWHQGIA